MVQTHHFGLMFTQRERRGNPSWLAPSLPAPVLSVSSRKHVSWGQVENAINRLRRWATWSPHDEILFMCTSETACRGSFCCWCRKQTPFNCWLWSSCGLLAIASWISWLSSDICAPCPACGHFSAAFSINLRKALRLSANPPPSHCSQSGRH